MKSTGWTILAMMLFLLGIGGCDNKQEAQPVANDAKKPTTEAVAEKAKKAEPEKKLGPFEVPPDLTPIACDGELALEDIPDHPVSGVINGRYLRPNMAFAKASKFMKQVSFDFGRMKHVKEDTPCFSTGLQLRASVYYKLDRVRQDKDLTVPAGTHFFSSEKGETTFLAAGQDDGGKAKKAKDQWRSWYVFEQTSGTPMSVNPPYYGVLVLDELGVEDKPEKPFAAAGRAKGKMAICFKDQSGSWLAGTFDMPVCR